jgi:UDP:flavonoid glycosyltransferase YjiC (YdhE family)
MPKHIVFTAIGSLGDLYPCLAMGRELRGRGHHVTIASTPFYRSRVEAHGIDFHPVRPDWDPTDPAIIAQCEDLKTGIEVLYRKLLLPNLRDTYDDLLAIARTADVIVTGELVYAAPLVAEKLRLPWVSSILSPFSFFSSHEPSVTVNMPRLIHLRKLGWPAYRCALELGRLATRHWSNPVRALRRELGLRTDSDPVFRDKYSPWLVLASFSPELAAPQPDWPKQTLQTGFIHLEAASTTPSELTQFLASGDPPVVFTQGSTAVHVPGDFYDVSLAVARNLGRRAILLGVKQPLSNPYPDVLTLPYAPYSRVFPRAAVNVHQGGSGTTGEAMRAGRPMLVVPYAWDQPDNAARIQRKGLGLHLPRTEYSVGAGTAALERLLREPQFAQRSAKVGAELQHEQGLSNACAAVERLLLEAA